MTNLSVLQRNMLGTMSEEAGALYLRGCGRDEWKACQMAWEADQLAALKPMISAAAGLHGATEDPGVWDFIKERQFRRWFPDGRSNP